MNLIRAFDTEREGWRDWTRYLVCRAVGHRPTRDRSDWYCKRCGDVLPQGNRRFQP